MRWLDTFIQDVRYGCRLVLRSPLLSAAIILTLALGVGIPSANGSTRPQATPGRSSASRATRDR